MARQRVGKARAKADSASVRGLRSKDAGKAAGTLQQRLSALERERDALRSELKQCEARMRLLEETHAQVRDRVCWALDSLHNILDGKG